MAEVVRTSIALPSQAQQIRLSQMKPESVVEEEKQ